jgi:hypothetical protein
MDPQLSLKDDGAGKISGGFLFRKIIISREGDACPA